MPPLLAGTAQGWPRLPALEWLLARAERTRLAQRDWRGWRAPPAAGARVVGAGRAVQQGRRPGLFPPDWAAKPRARTAGARTRRAAPPRPPPPWGVGDAPPWE